MTELSLDFDYMFKFVIIGDSGNQVAVEQMEALLKKTMNHQNIQIIVENNKGKDFGHCWIRKFQIHNKILLQRINNLVKYRANGITLVFYMKNRNSFENIKSCQLEINQYANKKIKSDLMQKKETIQGKQLLKNDNYQPNKSKANILKLLLQMVKNRRILKVIIVINIEIDSRKSN
ncbi:unnamed protein product [Paramecium pentaurelia]|uniref:Uncharacterized protein n=1 Tax=Paramecium pentaurelia TaxID=43138 RepID=A0A8S1T4X7_9CILI|nr:unnamed protein product [Paramecium pentaurelia]